MNISSTVRNTNFLCCGDHNNKLHKQNKDKKGGAWEAVERIMIRKI